MSQLFAQVAKVLEFQLQHQSFQRTPRTYLLQNGLAGSPCSPGDSRESSPTPQFKSINSSALSFLYSPTFTSIHDYWKNHSLDQMDFCYQSNVSASSYAVYVGHCFSAKEQGSFNFMAAVNICNDFGAQKNKVCHCFYCFPIYLCIYKRDMMEYTNQCIPWTLNSEHLDCNSGFVAYELYIFRAFTLTVLHLITFI